MYFFKCLKHFIFKYFIRVYHQYIVQRPLQVYDYKHLVVFQGPMQMGGGPPPGNGPQGPPGGPPHGHMPPHHGMMPGGPHGSPQYGHAPPGGAPAPPSAQPAPSPQPTSAQHPPSAQTPPHGQAPPPATSAVNGAPPSSSPMQGSIPAPGPDNLIALQRAIDCMEEKGLQEDPRYSQLLALRARSNPQDPSKGLFSNNQLCQLKAQITAYRSLARNQPLTQQLALIAAGKRDGSSESPTPPTQPPYEGQGQPPMPGLAGKVGGAGQGDLARGGGGAPPTPLPMTGQMAPPTQLTPPLVNAVSFIVSFVLRCC